MQPKTLHLIVAAIVAAFILLAGVMAGMAQVVTPKTIICTTCKNANEWAYKFCINCGAALTAMKETKLVELQHEREAARRKAVADSLAQVHQAEMARRQQAAAQPAKVNGLAPHDSARHDVTTSDASPRPESPKIISTARPLTRAKPDQQPWHKIMLREPAVLPRLFNVPTANVLGSLDIYFTGGGAFGIEKERNFLGRAGLGLGDIAEVEFATQSVINSLQRGSSSLPTSAFKMLIMRERLGLPAVAVALRGTTSWQSLDGSDSTSYFSFETRFTKLYLVASKRVNKVTGHFGIGLTDVRVRNLQSWNFMNGNPGNTYAGELQRNLWAPFGGISIQANPKTQVMLEIEGLPSYEFGEGREYSAKNIKNIWAGVVGVRFYFTNWLAADTGVRYRSDFDGIADANIQANVNLLLPLGRLRTADKTN
ncbi:YjbH domain-containing protein [candidate division KSB1 bacterium]|nr:YjbH domain-containing protein [candidate division KSB1 bacterium]